MKVDVKHKIGDLPTRVVAKWRDEECKKYDKCINCPIVSTVCNVDSSFINMEFEIEVPETPEPTCKWTWDDGYYNTDCGMDWCFFDGNAKDNGAVYCPKCGKKIEDIKVTEVV